MSALLARLTWLVERRFLSLTLGVVALFVACLIVAALLTWPRMRGFEPEWIARNLATGHGYSFDGVNRWLFADTSPDQYYPTAWADPVFTVVYAGLMYLFGETSRLLMMLVSLASVAAAAVLVALTARRIAGPWAGITALLLFLVTARDHSIKLNASLMAGFCVALMLYYFVRHADRLTPRVAAVLGAMLALTVLTWSSAMILLPAMVLLIVLFAPSLGAALRLSAVTALVAVLLVAPWTTRNYLAFGEVVPVRNGSGQIAFIGTVALAKTITPESVAIPVPPPWTASSAFDATARITRSLGWQPQDERRALEAWQRQVALTVGGADYQAMNEAQRDRWFLDQAKAFVLEHPALMLQIGAANLLQFVLYGSLPVVMAILGIFGVVMGLLLAFRQRLLLIPLTLLAAYAAPFVIVPAYFFRYRYPIEPAITVLVAVAAMHVAQLSTRRLLPELQLSRPGASLG
jgi:4-amino-4-deoxy-L-arabinose transferase-like glycosyltransferase